jgi:hypothetical protein
MSALPVGPLPETIAGFARVSLRALSAGGAVLRDPRLTPADLLLAADELVLLVHGFNNSEDHAFASYRDFMANIGPIWAPQSAGVFWPGDGRTGDPNASAGWRSVLLSAASYPYQPQRATEAAGYLVDVVTRACVFRETVAARRGRRSAELVVNIVAHSMGCRLALEMLRLLRSALTGGVHLRIRHVALMAAAVPGYHVRERGELEQALTTAERTTVYWSRAGTAAPTLVRVEIEIGAPGPRGWWPLHRGALGRGGVAERPRLRSVEVALGHSGYWPNSEVAESIRNDLEGRADASALRRLGSRQAAVRPVGLRPAPGRRA